MIMPDLQAEALWLNVRHAERDQAADGERGVLAAAVLQRPGRRAAAATAGSRGSGPPTKGSRKWLTKLSNKVEQGAHGMKHLICAHGTGGSQTGQPCDLCAW